MQPFSHSALVHSLTHAINRKGVAVARLEATAGLEPNSIADVLQGRKYASAGFLARLSHALGQDYSGIWIRYALWRFQDEMFRFQQGEPAKPGTVEPAREKELEAVARSIAIANPALPIHLLEADIAQTLGISVASARRQILTVRAYQPTGDYEIA